MRASALFLATVVLAGVAAVAQAAPTVYRIDPKTSRVVVHVHKAGAFSGFLHDHAFVPSQWHGEVSFDPASPGSTRGEVVFDAASLHDEEPGLSASDRAKVEEQVRGKDVLDAQRYPDVRLEITGAELGPGAGEGTGGITLLGTFSLHGKTQPVRIPVQARWTRERVEAHGSTAFDQSTFGIHPLKKALGTIAVQDKVVVDLTVVGATTTEEPGTATGARPD